MPLYLLKPHDDQGYPFNTYDEAMGFVVRAFNEGEARAKVATTKLGDGGPSEHHAPHWLDPKLTACTVIADEGPAAIILRDWCGD